MNKIFFLFIVVISYFDIYSINISGIVRDNKTLEVIPYVSVYVEGTTIGTITNKDGFFRINIEKSITLTFSCVGYEKKKVFVNTNQPKKKLLINLKQSNEFIDKVDIYDFSQQTLSKKILYAKNDILKQSNTNSAKTFVKLRSINDSNKVVELYEGYYTSIIKKNMITSITFKNALLKTTAENNIQSLDFCSFLPINTYVFYFPENDKNTNIIVNSGAYFINKIKNTTNNFVFKNPLMYNSKKKILENFTLSSKKIDDNNLIITYKNKIDTTNKGFYVIDTKTNKIKQYSLNLTYHKNFPISIVNKSHKILALNIEYSVRLKNNLPEIYNYILNYTYINDNRKTHKIKTELIYHIYKYNDAFSTPKYNLKSGFVLSDYNLLSITPINKKIWENENHIQNTNKDIEFLESHKSLKIVNKDLGIVKWSSTTKIDTSLIKHIKNPAYIYNIETTIFYDYYKTDKKVYIETDALFDYNKTYFSFKIPINFINTYFNLTKRYANILKERLLKSKSIEMYKSIYNETINELNLEKEKLCYDFNKYYGIR